MARLPYMGSNLCKYNKINVIVFKEIVSQKCLLCKLFIRYSEMLSFKVFQTLCTVQQSEWMSSILILSLLCPQTSLLKLIIVSVQH